MRCAASLFDLFPAGEDAGAAARFLRRRDRERCAASIPPTSARPARSTASPCARLRGPARRGQRSSASARATARLFGATATGDPLYQAVSRRPAAGRHGALAAVVRGAAGDPVRPSRRGRPHRPRRAAPTGARGAAARRSPIITPTATRAMVAEPGSYRPLEPETLYLDRRGMGRGASPARPIHLASPFPEPESDAVDRLRRRAGRAISRPSARSSANVYEAVADACRQAAARQAARSCSPAIRAGARERLAGPARRSRPASR